MALPLSEIYRNLAVLHGAGLPWPEAVERATGARSPRWDEVRDAVSSGTPLSDALVGVVPSLDLAGVRAGEASGRLEENLDALRTRHEREDRRRRETTAAVAYPVVLAHLGALLLPIPDLVAGRPLAGLCWSLALLVPTHALLLASRLARRAASRPRAPAEDGGLLRRFLTKAAVLEADARALEALGWLHDAGVPHLEAVPLAAAAGAGGRVARDLVRAEEAVRAGRPLATAWRDTPEEVRGSLVVGESTGRLGEACAHGAVLLEGLAALRRAKALALLKPLSMIGIGAIVGARLIAFYGAAFAGLRG